MAFSDAGNNAMLDALGALITHVGMFTGATALTGVTGEADTEVLTKASHGLSDGDVVVFTSLTGGTNLKIKKPYYVRDVNGNDFKLAGVSGGAALDFTTIADADLGGLYGSHTIDAAAEDPTNLVREYRGTKRYVRIVWTATGTHTNGTPIAGFVILGRPDYIPVTQPTELGSGTSSG